VTAPVTGREPDGRVRPASAAEESAMRRAVTPASTAPGRTSPNPRRRMRDPLRLRLDEVTRRGDDVRLLLRARGLTGGDSGPEGGET
jgi:hypothetical protein